MADSLQDQLRALGLAGKKTGKTKRKRPRRPDRGNEMPLEKAYALKARQEKEQAGRQRREKQEEDRRRRQLNKEIRQIVQPHRLNRDDAEVPRHFMFRGRIRKIAVTAEQLRALNGGELGIAYLSGAYHLLAAEHLEAVRQLSAEHVVDLEDGHHDDGDHPVPDDLVW